MRIPWRQPLIGFLIPRESGGYCLMRPGMPHKNGVLKVARRPGHNPE
ncbi:MAG: hypothetical protein LUC43_01505 [Burkholderiales bacterium]|nr:hypothetical protein [Burkholderiales bacterium]